MERVCFRYNLGRTDRDDILFVGAYDEDTDESRLVCIPFSEIERVEVFEGRAATAGKKVGFETAKPRSHSAV